MMALKPRLRLAAELCGTPKAVIDVGCDHGYLCAYLVQNGVGHAYASDIRPGPLGAAQETIRAAGLEDRITPVLCAGLEAFGPHDADTVVICGMGGETIAEILEAAPWTARGEHRLVLQPMTQAPRLRRWLREHGYRILQERLAREGKRLYCLLEVRGGTPAPDAGAYGDLFTESLRQDPLFFRFAELQLARCRKMIAGRGDAAQTAEEEELRTMLKILKEQTNGTGCIGDRRSGEGTEPEAGRGTDR